jgi:hypothetical protein
VKPPKTAPALFRPFLIFLLFAAPLLFGRGRREEEKREVLNGEFTLCVASFDVSALPAGYQIVGPILQRELAGDLGRIHHRKRDGEELSRYEELAFIAATRDGAVKLAAKREERDALFYRGYPRWKYRRELRKIDDELAALEEAYGKAGEVRPLIEERPLFKISEVNRGGILFPPPPERGGEEVFLKTHQADAVLTGTLRMAYGRIYAEFRVFTRGASFVYEDSTIFSTEDLGAASDELKSRFLAALVNSPPARLTILAEPEDARIEVNNRSAQSGEVLELPPGPVRIAVSADDHRGVRKELELNGGAEETLSVILRPHTMEQLDIALPGPETAVYMGALYVGGSSAAPPEAGPGSAAESSSASPEDSAATAPDDGGIFPPETAEAVPEAAGELAAEPAEIAGEPAAGEAEPAGELAESAASPEDPAAPAPRAGFFSVYVPAGQYRYIRVDTPEGLTGEAIVKGAAGGDGVRIIELPVRRMPGRNEKPVEEKRRKFYGAYGRFWIALPAAFFINGLAQTYAYSYNASRGSEVMYDRAINSYYVSIGAWVVAGAFLAETLVRMGIYVHTASEEAVPLWE